MFAFTQKGEKSRRSESSAAGATEIYDRRLNGALVKAEEADAARCGPLDGS